MSLSISVHVRGLNNPFYVKIKANFFVYEKVPRLVFFATKCLAIFFGLTESFINGTREVKIEEKTHFIK